MNYYNYVMFTPFIITLSTKIFKSKLNPKLSEFDEITKHTNLPLISDLQHNSFQNYNSSFFKLIVWLFTFLLMYNYFPDSKEKNYLFIAILLHFFVFHGDFKTDTVLIFNLNIHIIYSLFFILSFILFKYKYHRILPLQFLTIFLNILILYKDKVNNKKLSNNFVYLQWLNYIIEFFPYHLVNFV